ncbi:unnamed protein product [Lymnaea stagnalis]|uniref:RNA transcription, translation and transport factor protein n=1 Tax=Lymnaea stagnalis TaxID=6523 RepID=A0AAV2I9N4_LYMST
MFKRKLLALDFPDADIVDIKDDQKFRSLVVWLEDQKIRHLKIEDRDPLRNLQGEEWLKVLQTYLIGLNCPYNSTERQAVTDWLLGYAVRLEYGDGVDKYKNVTPEKFQELKTKQAGASSNPLDNLDFNSPEFRAGITSLAMMLQIPPYQDHLEVLKAICTVIEERFSLESMAAAKKSTEQLNKEKDEFIPLDKTELGFDAGDIIMTETAKILRLLHLHDLRDLQTKINTAIVKVQEITANPKTDSRLGKVGR